MQTGRSEAKALFKYSPKEVNWCCYCRWYLNEKRPQSLQLNVANIFHYSGNVTTVVLTHAKVCKADYDGRWGQMFVVQYVCGPLNWISL